ncbi:hypothetical protein KFK14_22530 [Sphingobium phenoxybenzoativorans]|uniref:Peptide O-xylosyltransferase n=2 Tax=Sphingobium phenoxybenzoativorans TaxID=1592790 RepID=A0A975K6H2_9SPHN|nr:hypothetical protein KFK14_22530 [Sphingobium phenoxybenzoativorans]
MTHEDPEHLRRLVDALETEESLFIIHINKIVDITPFHTAVSRPNLYFVENRVKLYWGGWNFVRVFVEMLKFAKGLGLPIEYMTILSGNSFPVQPVAKIHSALSEFAYINLVDVPSPGKPLKRFTRYYWQGSYRNQGTLRRLRGALLRRISKLTWRDPNRYLGDWKLYGGTAWCTLSAEAVETILRYADDRNLTRFFRHAAIPDEAFFHTILGNVHRDRCVPANLYQDWSDPVERPCHIRHDHLPYLLSDGATTIGSYGKVPIYFARKFSSRNADVVSIVEKHLQKL